MSKLRFGLIVGLGGALLGIVVTLLTLGVSITPYLTLLESVVWPTLLLMGSVILIFLLCCLVAWRAITTWWRWHQARKWLLQGFTTALIVIVTYIAVTFVIDRGPGAGLRAWPVFGRLPGGNLVMAAGPIGWLFVSLVVAITVITLWNRITVATAKLMQAWHDRPPRVRPTRRSSQPGDSHHDPVRDDSNTAHNFAVDDDKEEPDQDTDIGTLFGAEPRDYA